MRLEATSRLHPAARLEKERKCSRAQRGRGSSWIKERKKRESFELWILYARGANRGWLHGGEGTEDWLRESEKSNNYTLRVSAL